MEKGEVTPQSVTAEQIASFLAEDIGTGDITAAIVPEALQAEATVINRETMTLAGQAWFDAVFLALSPHVKVNWSYQDGDRIAPNQTLCRLTGPARTLLTGERSALNLLQTLSATATLARRYADAVEGSGVQVLDTRKTVPGLRIAQKYAVRCGGCMNHRFGLYDSILIKENHILATGSLSNAVTQCRSLYPTMSIESEVENLTELQEALAAGVDRLLLDNFDCLALKEAVAINAGRAELEASGNISLETIRAVAESGVDFISVGALTKNVTAIDLSMRIELGACPRID